MRIFITSDLHLNHFRILEFEADHLAQAGLSHIKTLDQYNDAIIGRINAAVSPKDDLYILGDFCFGGVGKLFEFAARINGRKILIKGNHDKFQIGQALSAGFAEAYDHPIYMPDTHGKVLLSHEPAKEAYNNPYIVFNLHGHLHRGAVDLPNYKNVNISMNDYRPVDFTEIRSRVEHGGKNRHEPFGMEWYAAYDTAQRDKPVKQEESTLDEPSANTHIN